MRRSDGEGLQLTPAMFHVLLALSDAERHGYGIMQEIAVRSGGQVHIGPGTLYRSIKQLLSAGLIEECDTRPDPALDDERRRYYRITAEGQRAGQEEAHRLAQLVEMARIKHLLGSEPGVEGAG